MAKIVIITQENANEHKRLLDEMFRMRARIFHDRLEWKVDVTDGRECDAYDKLDPIYILLVKGQKLLGSLRLLPTTGPTLLEDAFSETLPKSFPLKRPGIWECTRFCVSDHLTRDEAVNVSARLLIATGELALKKNVSQVLGIFEAPMMRIYKHIGCEVQILGSMKTNGATAYLGSFAVSKALINRGRARLHPEPVSRPEPQPVP